jgi:hypothetical protein
MTKAEAVRILRAHNIWRRGGEGEQTDPKQLGIALDTAIRLITEAQAQNKMNHPVTTETAVVFRAGGRRWFTKNAACRAAARAKINTRCECESAEPDSFDGRGYPGHTCWYHDQDRYHRLISKLASIYARKRKP